jgi:uncharacterized protein YjdB
VGCGVEEPLPPASPRLDLTASDVRLTYLGATAQVDAVLRDGSGAPLSGTDVAWFSADPDVATVSATGRVSAVGPGSTRIRATALGLVATLGVQVTQEATSLELAPATADVGLGQTTRLFATVLDAGGAAVPGARVTWSSLAPEVATVSASGGVEGRSAGSSGIVARAGSLADTAWVRVRGDVELEVELTAASLLVEIGRATTPEVTVRSGGTPTPGVGLEWTSSDPAVAAVDTTGAVTGVAQGRAWIRAAAGGGADSALVTVVPDLVTDAGPWDLDVRILGVADPARVPRPEYIAAVKAAERRWQSVIVGDLAFATPRVAPGECGVPHAAFAERVDDLTLFVEVAEIDGPGNTFGEVVQCAVRTSSGLPVLAALRLDATDLASLHASGDLEDALVREVGHVVGLGTSGPWDLLLVGAGTPDPTFSGVRARQEFEAAGLATATGVPVEPAGPGTSGPREHRWREAVFGREVMSARLDSGVDNRLSRITLGALVDLGYRVELEAADPWPVPGASPALRSGSAPGKLDLRTRIVGPLRRVDDGGSGGPRARRGSRSAAGAGGG